MANRFRFAVAFAGAFALAGCSGSEDNEAPAPENVEVNSFEVANDMILPEAEPAPEPEPAANAAAPIPLPDAAPAMDAVPEDTQVQDDAAAAGMTSRIQRDKAPAGNQDAPVE